MPKIVLSKEDGCMVVYGDHEDYDVIEENIVDQGRWTIAKKAIFHRKSDNTYWTSSWREGATEYQEERPFEYEDAEFFQVEPKEVTITSYVIIKD